MRAFAIAILLVTVRTATAQHLDYSKVVVSTTSLRSGVYMLQGAGSNVVVSVGNDGAFVVDDEFAPLSDRLLAAARKVRDVPVRYVANTHWHSDHTGGNANMVRAGATIIAHENVRRRMTTRQVIEIEHDTTPASPASALPTRTFARRSGMRFNGDSIVLLHVPRAHTDGDAIVVFRTANVIATGDIWLNGSYPYIDVSTGGSLAGTIAAVDRVLALSNDSTKLVPGHGDVGTRRQLREYRHMLVSLRDRVAPLVARGMTIEQVIAAKPLASLDARWGQSFIPSELALRIVYANLAQSRK
ncbi:MAG: MBL fold metallo-hydrolase [Gemmatimonadaceae bacterium]